jgi:hypothetical protein
MPIQLARPCIGACCTRAFIPDHNHPVRSCVAKWDVDTQACELRLRQHSLGIRALARLDANAVLSGSLDMTVSHRARVKPQ